MYTHVGTRHKVGSWLMRAGGRLDEGLLMAESCEENDPSLLWRAGGNREGAHMLEDLG